MRNIRKVLEANTPAIRSAEKHARTFRIRGGRNINIFFVHDRLEYFRNLARRGVCELVAVWLPENNSCSQYYYVKSVKN